MPFNLHLATPHPHNYTFFSYFQFILPQKAAASNISKPRKLASMASSLANPSMQQLFDQPRNRRPTSTSIPEKPSQLSSTFPDDSSSKLPLRKLPGGYGLPFLGPIRDRLNYFYWQGQDEFFKSRMQKYNSTVFRSNMPPGPFISSDPRVIVLLDGKSFPILFDVSKVEKKDVFTGTYMPSKSLTGGYRVLAYLDPSEPKHTQLKRLIFYLVQSSAQRVIPEFSSSYSKLFDSLEKEIAKKGKAEFSTPNDQAAFNFLGRAFFETNPPDTELGTDGPTSISLWLLFQLHPIITLGIPLLFFIEDPTIHTFRLPSFLIKSKYNKLYKFFNSYGGPVLDEAEKLGISRDEATHNILFATCFNTFGGMKIFFPTLMKYIGRAGVKVHNELAQEIRSVIKSNGGEVTMGALEQMPLMKSVVYEAFRIDPPVPFQYGKAKQDLVIESHDASFEVKKGEMLFGYQPFATKDPKIFEQAEEFVADRFVGEGEKLVKHVLWSNGFETDSPTVGNKQCAGKDFVVLISRLFVVELFMLYDTFEVEVGAPPLGTLSLKSFKRASF